MAGFYRNGPNQPFGSPAAGQGGGQAGNWMDGFGGQKGLLALGASLLGGSANNEATGESLLKGLNASQQVAQNQARNNYYQQRARSQQLEQQMQMRKARREQEKRDSWNEFLRRNGAMQGAAQASSLAGSDSQLDSGAVDASQRAGLGPVTGQQQYVDQLRESGIGREQGQKALLDRMKSVRENREQMQQTAYKQDRLDARNARDNAAQMQRERYKVANRRPTAAQRNRQMLIEAGTSPDVASKISGGAYTTTTDTLTGEPVIIDQTTGKRVNTGPGEAQAAASVQGSAGAGAGSSGVGPASGQSSGDEYSAGDIDEGFNGAKGLAKSSINALSQAIGFDAPYKDRVNAERTAQAINRQFVVQMAQETGGRASNYTQQQSEKYTPSTDSLFQGKETALSSYRQMSQLLGRKNETLRSVVNGRYTPQQRADAKRQLADNRQLQESINSVIDNWGTNNQPSYESQGNGGNGGNGGGQSVETDPEVESLVQKYKD